MDRTTRRALAALAVGAAATAPAAAAAAPTPAAELVCGATTFVVDGFGRGQVLHVVDGTASFVVTGAQLAADGTVVASSPARADRPVVTCTTTTPGGTGYVFTGFFTPARGGAAGSR